MDTAPAASRGRGRPSGFTMSNEHRTKIQNSQVLKCLIEHATGQRDMSATQVTAGVALLKKCLPDLSTVTLQGGEGGGPILHQIELVGVRASGESQA